MYVRMRTILGMLPLMSRALAFLRLKSLFTPTRTLRPVTLMLSPQWPPIPPVAVTITRTTIITPGHVQGLSCQLLSIMDHARVEISCTPIVITTHPIVEIPCMLLNVLIANYLHLCPLLLLLRVRHALTTLLRTHPPPPLITRVVIFNSLVAIPILSRCAPVTLALIVMVTPTFGCTTALGLKSHITMIIAESALNLLTHRQAHRYRLTPFVKDAMGRVLAAVKLW